LGSPWPCSWVCSRWTPSSRAGHWRERWLTSRCISCLVLAWHRPWVGGVSFVLLAAAYALTARYRIDWIVAISGPLLIVGVLYLWSGGTEILDRSEAESFNSQPPTPNSQKASRSYLLG